MIYTTEQLLNCLILRRDWYQKAIDLRFKGESEIGFDFPEGCLSKWIGAEAELQNTINMMEAK